MIVLLILFIIIPVGVSSYIIAKNELIEAGKLDLLHITETAKDTLVQLNERVEAGELTLEEAHKFRRENDWLDPS